MRPRFTITRGEAQRIERMLAAGYRQSLIARRFHLSTHFVSRVANGKLRLAHYIQDPLLPDHTPSITQGTGRSSSRGSGKTA